MAGKRSSQHSQSDDVEVGEEETHGHHPPPAPTPTPSAVSTKETDYMGLSLITPGTVSKDYMGRLTTATVDYMGRTLLDV
jgi:hypothetical protein